jgi:hypothetical protein
MRGARVSLRAGRQPSPLFGGGNALESGPLHRTMVGVHRHDSHGGDVLGRHAERDQGRVGQANVEAVASGACCFSLYLARRLWGPPGIFARSSQPSDPRRLKRPRGCSAGWSSWRPSTPTPSCADGPGGRCRPDTAHSGRLSACPGRSASGLRRASHGGCSLPSRVHRDGA